MDDSSLIGSFRNKDHKKDIALIYVGFAYWLGIAQDFYYGVEYLLDLLRNQEATGSFPFMFGWTAIMLWGVAKPVERRAVLLLTGVLAVLMLIENLVLLSAGKLEGNPYVPIGGALLWLSAYVVAGRSRKEGKR